MNRCDICGKFRAWDFLDSTMITPDSEYTSESWSTVCSKCAPEDFKNAPNRCRKCNELDRFENLEWKEELFGSDLVQYAEHEDCIELPSLMQKAIKDGYKCKIGNWIDPEGLPDVTI